MRCQVTAHKADKNACYEHIVRGFRDNHQLIPGTRGVMHAARALRARRAFTWSRTMPNRQSTT